MAVVLKTTAPETVPGVRIPLPPPMSQVLDGEIYRRSQDSVLIVPWSRRMLGGVVPVLE
jgi:hypothetical protein